jgi:hypothetical protein
MIKIYDGLETATRIVSSAIGTIVSFLLGTRALKLLTHSMASHPVASFLFSRTASSFGLVPDSALCRKTERTGLGTCKQVMLWLGGDENYKRLNIAGTFNRRFSDGRRWCLTSQWS